MPAPAFILLVAALMPLGAFALLLSVGSRIGSPRSRRGGTALAGWIATTAIAGSFLCSLLAMYQWYVAGGAGSQAGYGWQRGAIYLSTKWIPVGPQPATGAEPAHAGWLDVGLYIDSLTIALFSMITIVALLVHVFAIGYMRGERRFPRFFTYLSLFCFAMLGLVLAGTLVQVFVFWELVGFCSYLLIGFWFERPSAARAATKAFVVNRVGDAAFLVAFGLLFATVGNASLPHLWAALGSAGQGGAISLGDGSVASAGLLTAIGICLFLGAAGKSAQFPLHTWLPDAMEGPTPVSALIHAATMVAAGVYLMARMFPLLTPDAKLVVAICGCVTLALGALAALVQTDIKRVLAYSTISQLGYMMLAIGIGSWAGALFHLITHAFFKALLFLGAGSVIHAAHHEQDMRQFGGLWKRIPVTAASMLVAVAAISGVGAFHWGFSGYHSKSHLLSDAAAFAALVERSAPAAWLLFAVPAAVAWLTPFYMTRMWVLTFVGTPRDATLHDQARESPMMYVPLMGLAFMSIIAGWEVLAVRHLLQGSINEAGQTVAKLGYARPADQPAAQAARTFAGWASSWPFPVTTTGQVKQDEAYDLLDIDDPPPQASPGAAALARGRDVEHRWVGWAWAGGMGLAALLYWRGLGVATFLLRVKPIRWVNRWLLNAFYLDALYSAVATSPVRFASALAGWFDRVVVDGVVNLLAGVVERLSRAVGWNDREIVDGVAVGVGQIAWEVGSAARAPQAGRIRLYVAALLVAVVIGVAITTTVALLRW
jgi:proton-translocating NADH-quinone oxidoreductase chain L